MRRTFAHIRTIRSYSKSGQDLHKEALQFFMRENFSKAVELYEEAIEKGSVVSINNLAIMYAEGIGIPKDEAKSIKLYKKGIQMNDPHSMYNLARILMKQGKVDEAFDLLSITPKLGEEYSHCISTLGYILIYEKNQIEKGVEMYKLAISYGHKASNAHLAELYLDGTLEKNEEKARELMLIAAQDETDKRSMTTMATFYLTGLGGEIDVHKAIDLFEKAINLDYTTAMNQLGLLYVSGGRKDINDTTFLIEPDLKKAFDLFKKSADLRDATGMLNLAWIYLNGMGVPQDNDLGMKHLIDAAKNGSTEAKEVLEQSNIKY
jgi:uncharacterized protein